MVGSPSQEINLISCGLMTHISDIKLIRTDTTFDLSQKAEKPKEELFLCLAMSPTIVSAALGREEDKV